MEIWLQATELTENYDLLKLVLKIQTTVDAYSIESQTQRPLLKWIAMDSMAHQICG